MTAVFLRGVGIVEDVANYYGAMSLSPANKPAMPEAEVIIDLEMVRRLVATQAEQWADEDLRYLATGWDNEIYRLGESLIVRLPRRQLGEDIGVKERRWLPHLVEATGVDVGSVIFEGHPTTDYPFTFSICRYVSGNSAAQLARQERDKYVVEFSSLLRALHQPSNSTEPKSDFRGCPLSAVDQRTREQIAVLDPSLQARALEVWQEAVDAKPFGGHPVWLHGDPHPHNTIVDSQQAHSSVSLIDFGDLCVGDPASDLGMIWMHFSAEGIDQAFENYGIKSGSSTWLRARGWGLRFAMLMAKLDDDDLLGVVGRETLQLLLEESS